ncbi:CBS domain-containing protein [Francisella philomiragia]
MDLKDFKQVELSHFTDTKSINYLRDDASHLLYLESSALDVFRDYKDHDALTVRVDLNIKDVKTKIIDKHKDFALVINADDKVVGTISLHYIESQALHERIANSGVKATDLVANDIMIPIAKVNTVSYSITKNTKIGHILNTLINSDYNHIVVYDKNESGEKYIRGYFSLPYIRRKLGLDVYHVYQKEGVSNLNKGI